MPCSVCKKVGHIKRNCNALICDFVVTKGKNKGKTCGKRNCKVHNKKLEVKIETGKKTEINKIKINNKIETEKKIEINIVDDEVEFTIHKIQTDEMTATKYVKKLNSYLPCLFIELIEHAYNIIPELKVFCESNSKIHLIKDKGNIGKMVEFHIFGILPNTSSKPDILLGDIKTTHIKQLKSGGFNAKERLTITNVGSKADYSTFNHIVDFNLESNPRWEKIRKGVLVVLKFENSDDILNRKIVNFFNYDLKQEDEWMQVINSDYEKIKERVLKNDVSQKGQNYLHIHPHGSKKSKTRAFGFTNKFTTRLICKYTNRELKQKGKSLYFEEN